MFSWASFLLFAFASTITPGPNNIMSMSLGLQIGFKKTLVFNAGVLTGFSCVMLFCAFFCATLNYLVPQIMFPMMIAGTAYLIWLAWKIIRSTYNTKAIEPSQGQKFFSGLFLQFVNVKIFVYGIMAQQLFILPYYQDPWVLAAFAILLAIMGSSCNLIWSGFGSAFAHLFKSYTKPINALLALSLVFCAVMIWI